jgi:hypothetical protein
MVQKWLIAAGEIGNMLKTLVFTERDGRGQSP